MPWMQIQAWDFETTYKQILSKLKLDNIKVKVEKLSGGQKKIGTRTNFIDFSRFAYS